MTTTFALGLHGDESTDTDVRMLLSVAGSIPPDRRLRLLAPLTKVFAYARDNGVESPFLMKVFRELREVFSDPQAHAAVASPWPVKIYTLGRFSVQIDGAELCFKRKTPKRSLELLKAIITFGVAGVAKERLADALWPLAEGDAAAYSLSVSVNRLRKLIGKDSLQLRDSLSLNTARCWVDTVDLERTLRDLDAAMAPIDDVEHVASLAGRVLQLYRGPYLPSDEDAVWIASYRANLQRKVAVGLRSAGEKLAGSVHQALADRCRERSLELGSASGSRPHPIYRRAP